MLEVENLNSGWFRRMDAIAGNERRISLHAAYRAGAIALMNSERYVSIDKTEMNALDIRGRRKVIVEHFRSNPVEAELKQDNPQKYVVGMISVSNRRRFPFISANPAVWDTEEFYVRRVDEFGNTDKSPDIRQGQWELSDMVHLPNLTQSEHFLSDRWDSIEKFGQTIAALAKAADCPGLPVHKADFGIELDPGARAIVL